MVSATGRDPDRPTVLHQESRHDSVWRKTNILSLWFHSDLYLLYFTCEIPARAAGGEMDPKSTPSLILSGRWLRGFIHLYESALIFLSGPNDLCLAELSSEDLEIHSRGYNRIGGLPPGTDFGVGSGHSLPPGNQTGEIDTAVQRSSKGNGEEIRGLDVCYALS